MGLFILGKLYVANAGDSRAIICQGNDFTPMSADFTPENERERIRKLAALQPHLLGCVMFSICGLSRKFEIFLQEMTLLPLSTAVYQNLLIWENQFCTEMRT